MDRSSQLPFPEVAGPPRHRYARCFMLAIAYCLLAALSIVLTRASNSVANIWLANVVALALFIRRPYREWQELLTTLLLVSFITNLVLGSSVGFSIMASLANGLEVVLAAYLTKAWVKLDCQAPSPAMLLTTFAVYLFIATPLSSIFAAIFIWFVDGFSLSGVMFHWWLGDAIGLLLIGPTALLLSRGALKNTISAHRPPTLILATITTLVIATLLLYFTTSPFLYIACLLTLVAYWLGALPAALIGNLMLLSIGGLAYFHVFPLPEKLSTIASLNLWATTGVTCLFPALVGVAMDHIRRQRTLLDASEARFQDAMNFAATGFAIADMRGFLLEANPHLCQMLGYSVDELRGMTVKQLTHPDDLEQSIAHLQTLRSGECESYQFEKRYLHRSGRAIWVELRVSKLNWGQAEGHVILQIDNIDARIAQQQQILDLTERLSLATRAAEVGIWDWDLQTGLRVWDEAMYQLHWYLPSDTLPIDEMWLSRLHPEDKDIVQDRLRQVLRGAGELSIAYRLLGPHGEVRYLEGMAVVVQKGMDGRPLRMVGVSRDVTQQELAKRAEEQMHRELQTIIDHMPMVISYWDAQLCNRFANRAYFEWFGLSNAPDRHPAVPPLFNDECYPSGPSYVQQALQGLPQQFERLLPDAAGQPHDVVISYVPDKQYGQVQGFYAFITDVTLLRIAQDAVLEAQQHLQSVIDAASEFAIITTRLDGTIQMFSSGAERMLGYRAEELVGKQTLLLLHVEDEINDYGRAFPEAVLGFEALVHKVKQEGMDSQEWHYRRKTGDLVPVNLVVTAIHNLAGEISGFLGVARDIREQRLAQHTLQQAREQAEAANRAKSEFVANMSHEIRTPMNAVLGMCHLLGATPLNAEQNKYLEMLRASGQSLLGILNDILDFSKIEAGKLSLAPSPFVLEESMNALASMMSVTLGDKPLELAIGMEPETPLRLIGDPLRLQQILVNLTGNAIKFTEQGEVVVSIQCLNKDASAATLRFSVRDTGIGLTEEQCSRLFTPFEQADSSTTRRFGGTGLGLAICKRLVNLMGGELFVNSELGVGSEFHFTIQLPIDLDDSLPLQTKTPIWSRLLVVDDNAVTRHFLEQSILAWGGEVDLCSSAEQALELAQAQTELGRFYDAVLLDWNMPGQDSLSTGVALKGLVGASHPVPVILMMNGFDRKQAVENGALGQLDSVLIKPITRSSLFDSLHELLGDRTLLTTREPSTAQKTEPLCLRACSILLVEDNEFNQIVAKKILEQSGASVTLASNGQLAVDYLRQHAEEVQLVLMDVQMPVLDGLSATQIIRQELKLELPIIAMTAGVMQSEQAQYFACGMNDFIAKPINVPEMLTTICKNLGRQTSEPYMEDNKPLEQPVSSSSDAFDPEPLLKILGNDSLQLKKLVQQFIEENQGLDLFLKSSLQVESWNEAVRRLHTLKGIAATFKMEALRGQAEQLERLCKQGDAGQVLAALEPFRITLDNTLGAMKSWLEAQQETLPGVTLPLTEANFNTLLQQLDERNFSACDAYYQLRSSLLPQCSPDAMQLLDSAIDALDFEKASGLLRQQQWNIPVSGAT